MNTSGMTRSRSSSGGPLHVYLRIKQVWVDEAVSGATALDLADLQASLQGALAERLSIGAAAYGAPTEQRSPSLTQVVADAVATRVGPSLNRTEGAERG